ncbi:MAG: STAS/SEC14 domain-containing protein [Gammaproteobacteria bacterium]|nr:STAS/SEC14 domain-containing protein [Gammaproteobacteria bacterium]
MSIEFEQGNNDVAVFRVSGVLKKNEFEGAQCKIEEVIKKTGHMQILIITENFEGWEHSGDWGDWSFAERNDSYIDKIAVVGDEKWRDSVFAFTGKGFRPVAIEYFDAGQ